MGQKAHPYGLRVGYIKPWKSRWLAKKNAPELVEQDLKIRKFIKDKLGHAGVANIEIERSGAKIRVRIHSARPGVIIGRRGQEIDKVREELAAISKKEIALDIKEVKNPYIDAQLVAENIALQLEKRVSFRKAMKKAMQSAMTKGALGIKVACKGRLGGAEIARAEGYHEGKVPLNTFRSDVDYGFTEAHTTYGSIGCKVWIYKGDILVKKQEAEERKERERKEKEFEEELSKRVGAAKTARDAESAAEEVPAAEVTHEENVEPEISAELPEEDLGEEEDK